MNKQVFFLLVCLLIGVNVRPAAAQSTFCYLFNFRVSDYFFITSAGAYTSDVGFVTNEAGRVAFSYINSAPVAITSLQMGFTRGSGATGDIHMSAYGNIFGLNTGAFVPVWLAVEDEVGLAMQQPGVTPGTALSFLADSDKAISVNSMQVSGIGSNPFGSDNCTDLFPIPTPAPTAILIPGADIINGVSAADQQLASVNTSLLAPNGIPLLPLETGVRIMQYTKWLTSYQAAQKVSGPFAPLIASAGIYIAMRMALVAIYAGVYIGEYILRWLIWVFRLILTIIQTLAAAVKGLVGIVLGFIGL